METSIIVVAIIVAIAAIGVASVSRGGKWMIINLIIKQTWKMITFIAGETNSREERAIKKKELEIREKELRKRDRQKKEDE